jgi:hypothetical protein
VIAAAGLLVAAALSAAPAHPGSGPRVGNVIVTVTGKALLPGSSKPLGKSHGLAWAAWPAESAADASHDSGVSLAYLDEDGFRRETAGLKPGQSAEVMRKRAAERVQTLSDLADGLANEAGRIGAWIGSAPALEIHREGYFTGRFIYESVQDIEDLIRTRSHLQTLEGELLARADCPPQVAEGLRKRDSTAVLAKLFNLAYLANPANPEKAAKPGKHEKAAGPPGQATGSLKRHDPDPRVLYAREIFPWLAPRVKRHDFVVDKAGKGYLIPQTPEEIAKLPPSMHPIVAFLNTAESARAVRMLTDAQMERRIDALVARHGVGVPEYLAEILDGRLRMLATIRQFLASPKVRLAQEARVEMESVYTQILAEARQAAADWFGPVDAAQGNARLLDLSMRLRVLGKFSATSGDAALIAWTQRSVAALEANP